MIKCLQRGFLVLVVVLLTVLAAPARAQGPADAPQFGPTAGTRELRLDNTWYAGAFPLGNGFAHQAPEQGSNSNFFAFGASLGYFLTQNLELGGGVSYVNIDGDMQIPGATAFGRAFAMLAPRLAGYGGVGASFQVGIPDQGNNQNVYGLGVDGGLELFVTDTWAVRLGVTYRHLWIKREAAFGIDLDTSLDVLGVNWGIAAYF